jgi:ATP-dependent RNA helicase DDX35
MADSDTFIPSLHTPSSLLPIARHKDALVYTVETNQITILVGQTGSGKTTQLPQYLEQAGWCNDGKVIAVTQASLHFTPLPTFMCCLDVDILQIP